MAGARWTGPACDSSRLYTGAIRAASFLIALLLVSGPAYAQKVEVTPFGGYRSGGAIATINGRSVSDTPSGPSAGVVVDVVLGPAHDGGSLEFLYSREQASVEVTTAGIGPTTVARMNVDQFLAGGLYDLSPGRIRPFLAGGLGFTRFATPEGSAVNFMLGGGAGAKFYANRHIGARIDGRIYVTILDATATGVCGGGCVVGFRVSPAMQFEFTAGLVVGF